MAKIDDFGEHIAGAAKERRQAWAERMGLITAVDIAAEPLSKTFPEPDWQGLIDDGLDPWLVALMHALRDDIPVKPRGEKLGHWLRHVTGVRTICVAIADGRFDRAAVEARAAEPDQSRLRGLIEGGAALYLAAGHERSLKGWTFGKVMLRKVNGVPQAQPQERWNVWRPGKGSLRAPVVSRPTAREALALFLEIYEQEQEAPRADRKMTFSIWFAGRNRTGDLHIGRKIGRDYITLATRPTVAEARRYRDENHDELVQLFERMRRAPAERGARNADRTGPDLRGGRNVTPDMFMATFGFRGVQFGTYVEDARRQVDLNRAYDALIDLADVVRVPPASLSLGGTLALAFGARGKGGVNAAAAHYEPDLVVINLTKGNGAGSLGHEWFHALDNRLARRNGRAIGYATNGALQDSRGDMTPIRVGVAQLMSNLARTAVGARSKELDRSRSSAYWSQPIEIAARAFESWVIDSLARKGKVNDYLANVVSEEVYEAEARLMMAPPGRYPYLKAAELPAARAGFEALFASPGVLEDYDPACRVVPQIEERPAAPAWIHAAETAPELGEPLMDGPADMDDDDLTPSVWM